MPRVRRVNTPTGGRGPSRIESDVDLGSNRLRPTRKRKNIAQRGVAKLFEFVNPYPWMSEPEALVQLELEKRGVPFSWRFFDGDAPNLKLLLPDFSPEFTLREYKAAILVIGGFFGNIPSIIDKNALATVLLQEDGWTVAILTEFEVRNDVAKVLDREIPGLVGAPIKGTARQNPYGVPDFMAKRRAQLSGQGLLRATFKRDAEKQRNQGGSETDAGRRRISRRRRDVAPSRRRFRRGD